MPRWVAGPGLKQEYRCDPVSCWLAILYQALILTFGVTFWGGGQLGVAVPRYAPPPKKKKYFAAMERFTTKVMNDDSVEALDLKETPAEHTLLDGLLCKCSALVRRPH